MTKSVTFRLSDSEREKIAQIGADLKSKQLIYSWREASISDVLRYLVTSYELQQRKTKRISSSRKTSTR
jgi:hypothetical protein